MYINQLMLDSVKVGRVRDRELPIHGNPPSLLTGIESEREREIYYIRTQFLFWEGKTHQSH